MARKSTADQTTLGDVVLDRLSSTTVPAALKPYVVGFKKSHTSLVAATTAAEAARTTRDAAIAAVTAADAALDAAVGVLANTIVGAGLGSRQKPFKGFSSYSPSKLTGLAYAVEAKEVLSITAKVKKVGSGNASVLKAAATCEKLSAGVSAALSKLSKPQLAYMKALGVRDALLPVWAKSLEQLKRNAAAVWFTDPATYKAVFAPPEKVQAPVHARKKKAPKKPPTPAAPPTPTKPA
jgi:hypothetical protein